MANRPRPESWKKLPAKKPARTPKYANNRITKGECQRMPSEINFAHWQPWMRASANYSARWKNRASWTKRFLFFRVTTAFSGENTVLQINAGHMMNPLEILF